MYLGHFVRKLDESRRLQIPKAFLQKKTTSFVINRYLNGTLTLHHLDDWEDTNRRLSKLLLNHQNGRELYRRFHEGATQLYLDTKNRIRYPSHLQNHMEIKDKVLFIGLGNRIELWNPENFRTIAPEALKSNDWMYFSDESGFSELTEYNTYLHQLRVGYQKSYVSKE